jgi:lysophospholipase L1-like esterase
LGEESILSERLGSPATIAANRIPRWSLNFVLIRFFIARMVKIFSFDNPPRASVSAGGLIGPLYRIHPMLRISSRSVAQLALSHAVAIALCALPAYAAERQWTGETDGKWQTPANWADQTLPSADDTAVFAKSKNLAIDLGADTTVKGVQFSADAAGAYVISGHTLTLSADGSIAKKGDTPPFNQTIESAIHLNGPATFSNDGNWVHMANLLILSGPITGDGALTIAGNGSGGVELNSDISQTFKGTITVKKGSMLMVGVSGALGDSAGETILDGGKILFNGGANTSENFKIVDSGDWESMNAHAQSGNIAVEKGATWTIGNGGGNTLTLSGVISGEGEIVFTAANTTLEGDKSNTLSGKITNAANSDTAAYDELRLGKTGGAIAIAGDLELQNKATVTWQENDQINDKSAITLGGGSLRLEGHNEHLGVLTVTGNGAINLGDGDTQLVFADSSEAKWAPKGQLLIQGYKGGSQRITFGEKAEGLTKDQLKQVGFANPAGQPAAVYPAEMDASGNLKPGATAITVAHAPFDLSDKAKAERQKLYDVPGLTDLTGAQTPLKKDMHISIFGDSITWLNGYITKIDNALAAGEGTKDLDVKVFNHGVNGGGAAQILNGSDSAGYDGKGNNAAQKPFAEVIKTDKADIAVVFIGINDVWWRNTTPEDFKKQMEGIAAAAKANGTSLVLATMATHGELPDGKNPDDAKIEQFSQITRDVAAASGAVLVDLRKAFIAYNQNHNGEMQLDGTMVFKSNNVLTGDGVHPNEAGNEVLAQNIAEGIYKSAKDRK